MYIDNGIQAHYTSTKLIINNGNGNEMDCRYPFLVCTYFLQFSGLFLIIILHFYDNNSCQLSSCQLSSDPDCTGHLTYFQPWLTTSLFTIIH